MFAAHAARRTSAFWRAPRARLCAGGGAAPPRLPPPSGGGGAQGGGLVAATAAVGYGAGALGACAGVGGALFVIPGLMRFGGLGQRVAAGNSLVAVTCISSTSAATFASAGAVDWPTAAILSGAAAVGAPAGALLSRRVDRIFLRRALGTLCVAVAPLMPVRSRLLARRAEGDAAAAAAAGPTEPAAAERAGAECAGETQLRPPSPAKGAALAGAGSAIGLCAGLLGIGGGSFFTAVTAVSSDAPLRTVLGTSLSAMVLPSAVAAAAYLRMGQVSVRLVPPLVVGSVAGAATGSRLALFAPEAALQWGFALVFTLLGVRLFRAPFKPGAVMRVKAASTAPPGPRRP